MSVGVPALDADHRCLMRVVSLLRGIGDADEAATMTQTVLDSLRMYVEFHFRREARVMDAFQVPDAAAHRAETRRFLRYLDDLRGDLRPVDGPEAAEALCDELAGWLGHHVLLFDKAYVPYVTDRERADAVAREGASACLLGLTTDRRTKAIRRAAPAGMLELPA